GMFGKYRRYLEIIENAWGILLKNLKLFWSG
ncbi:unnamed protein product, partial [marine sediment metagenome]